MLAVYKHVTTILLHSCTILLHRALEMRTSITGSCDQLKPRACWWQLTIKIIYCWLTYLSKAHPKRKPEIRPKKKLLDDVVVTRSNAICLQETASTDILDRGCHPTTGSRSQFPVRLNDWFASRYILLCSNFYILSWRRKNVIVYV